MVYYSEPHDVGILMVRRMNTLQLHTQYVALLLVSRGEHFRILLNCLTPREVNISASWKAVKQRSYPI